MEDAPREVVEKITYWREQLAGVTPVLELPADRPRPAVAGFRTAQHVFALDETLRRSLEYVADREGVAFDFLLLAAFQALLARYTRQDDIVVGAVLAGRDVDEKCLGSPANPLPIRVNAGADATFTELLALLRGVVERAAENQDVPLDRIVSEAGVEHEPSRHPLFQVVFSTDVIDASPAAGTKLDLQLAIGAEREGLSAQLVYASELFDSSTIARMAGHFEMLLGGVAANPAQPISRLPLLTDAERHQLVVEWNDTWTEYPRDLCVHELFERQAEKTPNATAAVFEGQQLTYAELNRQSNQLARHLIGLGVGPDVLVGTCVERSLEMLVGLLGILKAGGAYVPVDPAFPADRVAFMLEDAEAPVLLTQRRLLETLPQTKAKLVCLDSEWARIATESSENFASSAQPENLAYTMYTSGSTGKPKGVQIPHGAVVNFLVTMAEKPGMIASDRLLAVTTLSFDIAGLEIYLPLTIGASVEIVSRSVYSDGAQLLAKLVSSGANVLQATPATFRMLIEAGWKKSPGLKILIGGEAVPHKLANQLMQRAESVWNMYGPTETTIWSTVRKFEPNQTGVSIGRPIANTKIFILDAVQQPVPVGVAGELLIGGDGLARGYWKRPELTAEKFVPHPLSDKAGAQLYRTGDLARYRPNGDIEFLGRIDHQVKIRGFRIELGEIEAVLRTHPGVNETVVVAREDVPGDTRLVAYFVPQGAAPSAAELRNLLREKLPVYMVPAAFVPLREMPLTPNGKINRRTLPAPQPSEYAAGDEIVAPTDATEAQLVEMWESILGVSSIGVRNDFFELGGHSLLAVRLMQRIEQTFGRKLPATVLLQARTIEKLAVIVRQEMVRQESDNSSWKSLVPIQVAGTKTPFFCVHGAGGVVIRFYELAKHLGTDQPVYGLQARGLDGRQKSESRVEDMAGHYLEEIRNMQPQGPYLLGGYSLGGMIAFEMAHRLAGEGEESLVVMFDTFCKPSAQSSGNGKNGMGAVSRQNDSPSPTVTKRGIAASMLRTAKTVKKGIERRVSEAMLPQTLKNVREGLAAAAKNYEPRPYPGRVVLFRSSEKPLLQFGDPHVGWREYAAGGLEIREVEGDHDSILLEPQVQSVAEQLKPYLDQLEHRGGKGK